MQNLRQIVLQNSRQYLVAIRSSLWFIPGLMICFSILVALGLIYLDTRLELKWAEQYPHTFGLGADGSRGMLTAIASSMLTVAALCFSLTLSTISQASAQYSPRILRNFIRDRSNQFVLGYFVSVFAYCLVVLRTIRGGDELTFVPSLAVITGLVLAIGGILVLIYFIHHMATSLEVSNIIMRIKEETAHVIERLFPGTEDGAEPGDEGGEDENVIAAMEAAVPTWLPVASAESGYVQFVDVDAIARFAAEHNAVLRMEKNVGQFAGRGTALLMSSIPLADDETAQLNSFYSIDYFRTIEADVGFGIRQIVDIALKALSPGVNDTSTSINCIDYLGVIMTKLATRNLGPRYRIVDGELRVLVNSPAFDDYLGTAFDQIRTNGRDNLAVLLRMIKTLACVAECTGAEDRLNALKNHLDRVREVGRAHLSSFENETLVACYNEQLSGFMNGRPTRTACALLEEPADHL